MSARALAAGCVGAVMVAALMGCSSATQFVKAGHDFSTVGNVGVVVGGAGQSGAHGDIADLFAMELLGKGYSVIERANLEEILREGQLQNSPDSVMSEAGRVKLAISNVQTLAIVNIGRLDDDISMTSKMVDVKSGAILWIAEGTGDLKSGLTTIAGAAAGAAVGAGAGALVGGGRGAVIGGVAGGVGGGIGGKVLEPNQVKLVRKVVRKMCRDLPAPGGVR